MRSNNPVSVTLEAGDTVQVLPYTGTAGAQWQIVLGRGDNLMFVYAPTAEAVKLADALETQLQPESPFATIANLRAELEACRALLVNSNDHRDALAKELADHKAAAQRMAEDLADGLARGADDLVNALTKRTVET